MEIIVLNWQSNNVHIMVLCKHFNLEVPQMFMNQFYLLREDLRASNNQIRLKQVNLKDRKGTHLGTIKSEWLIPPIALSGSV